jgi:hypothetical protein
MRKIPVMTGWCLSHVFVCCLGHVFSCSSCVLCLACVLLLAWCLFTRIKWRSRLTLSGYILCVFLCCILVFYCVGLFCVFLHWVLVLFVATGLICFPVLDCCVPYRYPTFVYSFVRMSSQVVFKLDHMFKQDSKWRGRPNSTWRISVHMEAKAVGLNRNGVKVAAKNKVRWRCVVDDLCSKQELQETLTDWLILLCKHYAP